MFVEKFNGKNNHERSDSKQQRQRLWLKDRKLRATVPQPSFINHHHHHHHCLCQTTATATHDNATTTHCWRAGYRPCRPVHWTYCGLGECNRLLLSFLLSFPLSPVLSPFPCPFPCCCSPPSLWFAFFLIFPGCRPERSHLGSRG